MHMIFHTADAQSRALNVIKHTCEVGVEFLLDVGGEARSAMLGAEHKMCEEAGQ